MPYTCKSCGRYQLGSSADNICPAAACVAMRTVEVRVHDVGCLCAQCDLDRERAFHVETVELLRRAVTALDILVACVTRKGGT
jgi:hypothetical protein